ncbi:hypothetical protein P7C71_g5831, partial [Lecanoromycetidae sp. Uapishka_2]
MALEVPRDEVIDLTDDRPLAVRRKRRISTGIADPVYTKLEEHTEEIGLASVPSAKTPSKPKKRVRFSDPGPETESAFLSTGLTPYLSNTHFTPRDRESSPTRRPKRAATGPRRLSLPAQLSTSLPSPSLSPSPGPLSGEIQFAPLRQLIDPRSKRRLTRNHLSEEMNDFEAEKKSKAQLEDEIKSLKDQLAAARQSGQEHGDGAAAENTGAERIEELEQELGERKQEMRERSMTAEAMLPIHESSSQSTGGLEIYIDNDDDLITPNFGNDDGVLRDISPIEAPSSVNEAATQAALPSAHTETFRTARLSLEYLFPGEIALGLVPEDPKPLLDTMLERLNGLKAQNFVAQDALRTTRNQESNLRTQFNAVLGQLDRARKYAEEVSTRANSEKVQTANTQATILLLQSNLQATSNKVNSLEKEADDKDRSIRKLQDALDTYRVEVSKLEELITSMEGDHRQAMSKLQGEMDEAVADLECHVAAELRGRREAEQEVDAKNNQIKQLKLKERELKDALNEKQRVIRETERLCDEERAEREREVGALNARVGQLSSDASESFGRATNAEQQQAILLRKLQEEREAALRAIEAVQEELAQATKNTAGIKAAHLSDGHRRGAEVTEHKGLLTPVSATRFKDVEGYVEIRRGKGRGKRPDSGIVIFEEDEDEDMIMADDM